MTPDVCAEMDTSEVEAIDMSVCPHFESARCLLYYPDGSNLFVVVRGYNAALDAAGTCKESYKVPCSCGKGASNE